MESFDEVVMVVGSKDQTHIVKGKRTKRQRPQSPIPFSIATHSSSGEGSGGDGGGGGGYGSNGDNFYPVAAVKNNNNNNTASSRANSAEFGESATEEEEDMANCLILLAQGRSKSDHEETQFKFTSKRFLEAPILNGKVTATVGMYVYQCKTCNRSFPSFQALGGHRASHKKFKSTTVASSSAAIAAADEAKKRRMPIFSDEEEDEQFKNHHASSSSLSLQPITHSHRGSSSSHGNPKSSSKIHECSICGAEFTSGQALGGHMRRHRAPLGAYTALSLSPSISGLESENQEAKRQRNALSLDLDLNLPAPPETHHQGQEESKAAVVTTTSTTFASKQQQKQQTPLLMSAAPTLVDCHY
ncbi:hypothetical protein U1Q18_045802 [Sarracenia purpurea var. burkii]